MISATNAFACYAVACWLYDVLWRPAATARVARQAANARGKPLLNMGAGTPSSSVRSFFFGPTYFGDVNLDVAAPPGPAGRDRITYGDVHCIPYPDGYFGAALASHLLEHVDNPSRALAELERVADAVYVVVPKWWCPHTWMHLGHRWFITNDGRMALPLWQRGWTPQALAASQSTQTNPRLAVSGLRRLAT